jgi:hypothetical protein
VGTTSTDTDTTGERPIDEPKSAMDLAVSGRRIPRPRWPFTRPLLPERMRRQRRPRLWQEIAFIALSYWVYSLIRDAVPTHETPAFEHARSILDAEKSVGIDVELAVNHFVNAVHWGGWHWLANVFDYYYAVMHFVVVIAVLVWVYVHHPLNYRSTRTALYAANGLAAVVFWLYPLAPPRLMSSPHFVDTVVVYHTWGSWGSGGMAKVSNQFAAMPSLHIGWSLWAGLTLFMLSRRWWIRVLGLAYPVATFMVIIGTANHFVLDAAGGVAVLTLGFAIQRLLTGRPAYSAVAVYPPDPEPVEVHPATHRLAEPGPEPTWHTEQPGDVPSTVSPETVPPETVRPAAARSAPHVRVTLPPPASPPARAHEVVTVPPLAGQFGDEHADR